MNWEELQQSGATEIAGAVSGGLDSCTVANWLKNKGFKVHCFTVDLGQPDEENLDAVTNRMIDCGAHKADILPGLEQLAEAGVKAVIQPGGSKNDKKIVEAANNAEMVMAFTGVRHFKH